MPTGPNQILIKRSDVAGVVPSGLSFGEPAINSADGVLFLSQQTEGSATSDLWEFRGFTNEGFITSVNGSTGAVTAISSAGLSNSTGFNDITGLAFASTTQGLTLSITKHGNTAAFSIDADSLASNIGDMLYTLTVITGALNPPVATSNGQMIFNSDTLQLSFFKFGLNGEDYRTILSQANALGSGQIQFSVDTPSADRTFIFYYDHDALSYNGTKFDLTLYGTVPDGFDISEVGSGKPVKVTMVPDGGRVAASTHFRTPEGSTFGTVVSSFNGITGDVTTNGLILPVAGISSNGGITVGGTLTVDGSIHATEAGTTINAENLSVANDSILRKHVTLLGSSATVPDSFDLHNASGNQVFDVATRNVQIGDLSGAGNSNKINIKDSHDAIYITSPTVRFNNGSKLINDSDSDTHIHFAGGNVKNLVAGGITYAQGTVNGLVAPVGLSAAGGVTFADNVSVGATLSVDNDVVIGNGRDIIFDGSTSSRIIQNGNEVMFFDNNNGVVRIPIFSLGVSQILSHNDDSDTRMQFLTNNIKVEAGGNVGLDINATNTTIDGVTFDAGSITSSGGITVEGNLSAAGATFAGKVTIGSTLSVDTDIDFTVTSEDAVIRQGGSAQIRLNDSNGYVKILANTLLVPTKVTHTDDTNTFIHFKTDQILLNAGGDVVIDANATNTTIDGVTFDAGSIVTSGGITVGGNSNFLDNDVSRPNLKDYSEHVNAIGTITGNTAISFADGNVQTVTGNGNCEFSFTNPPASGKAGTLTLIITNGGANTTTFASPVKWPSDVAPSLTSSGVDILSFVTTDAGSNIFGFVGGLNFS